MVFSSFLFQFSLLLFSIFLCYFFSIFHGAHHIFRRLAPALVFVLVLVLPLPPHYHHHHRNFTRVLPLPSSSSLGSLFLYCKYICTQVQGENDVFRPWKYPFVSIRCFKHIIVSSNDSCLSRLFQHFKKLVCVLIFIP